MLEFLSEVWCIGDSCRTISYWIGSAVGTIVILGLIPAIIIILVRKFRKKRKKSASSQK